MRCAWKVMGLCTLHEQLLLQRNKDCFLWCHNVLWFRKPNFNILWHFFARFSAKALILWPFCKTLIKFLGFGFFFFGVKDECRTSNQPEVSCPSWKNSNWRTKVDSRSLWWGDDTMSRTHLFEWHRRFKEGREEVEDDQRSGRPSTSRTDENVERVRQKVQSDCRLTVRMIADELGMNSKRVWRIITKDLEMRKICAKMEPRLLNEGQKERHVQVCQDILEQIETEPNLLKRVVTGDEPWIFKCDLLTKRQSLEWNSALSPWPKKVRVFKSKTKVMLIAFFDVHGIVQAEFLPQGQTINQHIYKNSDVWFAQWGRKEESRRKRVHGYFVMTMFQLIMPWEFGSFLPKITLLYWSNYPTLQIWPHITSFCFRNSRNSSKELVFKIQKPLKQPWRESSKQFRRNPSRGAWKQGRGDWKSAFEPKEITLKPSCCKIYLSNKIKPSSITFQTHLRVKSLA